MRIPLRFVGGPLNGKVEIVASVPERRCVLDSAHVLHTYQQHNGSASMLLASSEPTEALDLTEVDVDDAGRLVIEGGTSALRSWSYVLTAQRAAMDADEASERARQAEDELRELRAMDGPQAKVRYQNLAAALQAQRTARDVLLFVIGAAVAALGMLF